jgi:hypothetical protein
VRYIHKWYTPIIVKVFDCDENWYYGPCYNPRHVPALTDVSTKIYLGWYTDEDSEHFFTKPWRMA